MSNRTYNIFFHLHTVSGIVISVALYVIFFAGAFALFTHEIEHWEEGTHEEAGGYGAESEKVPFLQLDFDHITKLVEQQGLALTAKDIHFYPLDGKYRVYLSASKDSVAAAIDKKAHYLLYDAATGILAESKNNTAAGYSLGLLLFRLHFFDQLGAPGYYLAGLVSLLFLFALVSGVVVHWKKLIPHFYLFRPFAKLKTVWTDAHTALGTIGLPFQFMYALTGAVFCLGVAVYIPSSEVLYDGNEKQYNQDVFGGVTGERPDTSADFSAVSLNRIVHKADAHWDDFKLIHIKLFNYGYSNAVVVAEGNIHSKTILNEVGYIIYDPFHEMVLSENNPFTPNYTGSVATVIRKLHYGEYGELGEVNNILLKVFYFVLTLISCFVILTGVLIWLEARRKKNIPEKQRRFNERVGYIFLAICLTMLPITALTFVVSKLLPESLLTFREIILDSVFFGGWLLMAFFFWLKKNNYYTNKYTLLSGGIIGLFIPLVSGLYSGNWFWNTLAHHHYDVFIIDVIWLFMGISALFAVYRMKKQGGLPVKRQ